MALDPASANFLLKYLTEIILGLVVVLLTALKLLGKRAQIEADRLMLAEPPVTKVELLEFKLEMQTLLRAEFDKFHTDLRKELRIIHRRIDEATHKE